MNVQRETIYGQRKRILEGADLRQTIMDYLHQTVQEAIDNYCTESVHPTEWDVEGLHKSLNEIFPLEIYARVEDIKGKKRDEMAEFLDAIVERTYLDKEEEIGVETMRDLERHLTLQLINNKWMDHLEAMDYLREGISLRSYAQQDPLIAYKKEAYDMFMQMQHSIQDDIVRWMYRVQLAKPEPQRRRHYYNVVESGAGDGSDGQSKKSVSRKSVSGKVGPNDPCPCGSGKKYKKCCMGKE
jgi:preprotein translocase subunit SecA